MVPALRHKIDHVFDNVSGAASGTLGTSDLAEVRDRLAAGLGPAADDGDRVDRIRLLEAIKSAAAAAQARETAAFDASQRAVQAAAGVPAERVG